jgi:hypothetical protein
VGGRFGSVGLGKLARGGFEQHADDFVEFVFGFEDENAVFVIVRRKAVVREHGDLLFVG